MRKDASSIRDVLTSVIEKMSGEKKQKINQVKDAWNHVLGEKAAVHARPVSFRQKRLTVNVDSSVWMYELNLKKQDFRAKLNQRLNKDNININEIVFRVGEI